MSEIWKKYLKEGKIKKSTRKDKKLMVDYNGKIIHFGALSGNYQHFYDKTRIYKHLDHNDEERKKNYIARHSKIKNKNGEFVINDPSSSSYWAKWILW